MLQVWRFDDGVVRSHVVAESQPAAVECFDRVMGREYRNEFDDVVVEIYPIDGSTILPIVPPEGGKFVEKTADEWIAVQGAGFL